MQVAIISYNAGNVQSVQFALERLGIQALLTDEKDQIIRADKVIIPGVGEAQSAMKYMVSKGMDKVILSLRQPVLGICLGLQLMCRHSEEGDTRCMGIFEQDIKKFENTFFSGNLLKVPQVGWNNIFGLQGPLFDDIEESSFMYFLHGYYAESGPAAIASTNYGTVYSAALQKDNFYAVQFHPEKSGEKGQKILENFLRL